MTFREITDVLTDQEYPVTAEDLAERCGDYELEHPNGNEQLSTVIERTGETRFESALDAQLAICGVVGAEAVGRVGYSDRDPAPMGTDGPRPVSF